MPSSDYLDRLRVQLRTVIAHRDTNGLTDAVADRINDLECLIAHEERRLECKALSGRLWWVLSAIFAPDACMARIGRSG